MPDHRQAAKDMRSVAAPPTGAPRAVIFGLEAPASGLPWPSCAICR